MRFESMAKLILRLVFGGLMLTHGWPKLDRLLSTGEFKFGDPIGLGPEVSMISAIFAEFVCAILVMLGYKTKLATIPLMFTMLVAALIVHADDPFGRKEKALLFFIGFLVILLMGPGKYSIDHRVRS